MNDAVQKIVNEINESNKTTEQQVVIDPLTISLLFSILGAILQGIRLYCQWRHNKKAGEQISDHLQRKSLLSRRTVKKYVKANMSSEDYALRGNAIIEAILSAGSKATPEYITKLLNDGVYNEA